MSDNEPGSTVTVTLGQWRPPSLGATDYLILCSVETVQGTATVEVGRVGGSNSRFVSFWFRPRWATLATWSDTTVQAIGNAINTTAARQAIDAYVKQGQHLGTLTGSAIVPAQERRQNADDALRYRERKEDTRLMQIINQGGRNPEPGDLAVITNALQIRVGVSKASKWLSKARTELNGSSPRQFWTNHPESRTDVLQLFLADHGYRLPLADRYWRTP